MHQAIRSAAEALARASVKYCADPSAISSVSSASACAIAFASAALAFEVASAEAVASAAACAALAFEVASADAVASAAVCAAEAYPCAAVSRSEISVSTYDVSAFVPTSVARFVIGFCQLYLLASL
jgi:hypothetical protein